MQETSGNYSFSKSLAKISKRSGCNEGKMEKLGKRGNYLFISTLRISSLKSAKLINKPIFLSTAFR